MLISSFAKVSETLNTFPFINYLIVNVCNLTLKYKEIQSEQSFMDTYIHNKNHRQIGPLPNRPLSNWPPNKISWSNRPPIK